MQPSRASCNCLKAFELLILDKYLKMFHFVRLHAISLSYISGWVIQNVEIIIDYCQFLTTLILIILLQKDPGQVRSRSSFLDTYLTLKVSFRFKIFTSRKNTPKAYWLQCFIKVLRRFFLFFSLVIYIYIYIYIYKEKEGGRKGGR